MRVASLLFLVGAFADSVNVGARQPTKILCRIQNYQDVSAGYTKKNIESLNKKTGDITLGVQDGGGWCTRIACQWENAIYACNDRSEGQAVNVDLLAGFATDIMNNDTCRWSPTSSSPRVQGQAFDADGWNVIIGMRDDDSC